jgi:hypothetical protein
MGGEKKGILGTVLLVMHSHDVFDRYPIYFFAPSKKPDTDNRYLNF